MSSESRDFTPSAAVSLHTAVMRAGRAFVQDWDPEAVEILREVFASSPHRLGSLPIIVKRWPKKADIPKALISLITAVAGSGEHGEMLSSDEYKRRVDAAAAHWPSSGTSARQQLDTVHILMRQWIGGGAIKPFWYEEGGSEVLIDARLARAKNQTAFEAMLLYGIAPVDGGGPVWVQEAELTKVLAEHAKKQSLPSEPPRKLGRKPKIDQAAFERECHRLITENGMPNPQFDPAWTQADLERHMMEWTGEVYSESRVRGLVRNALVTWKPKA
jgi:hypothetical protein